jgi:hypothetical protein
LPSWHNTTYNGFWFLNFRITYNELSHNEFFNSMDEPSFKTSVGRWIKRSVGNIYFQILVFSVLLEFSSFRFFSSSQSFSGGFSPVI